MLFLCKLQKGADHTLLSRFYSFSGKKSVSCSVYAHIRGIFFSNLSKPVLFPFFCVLSFFLVDFRQCRAKLLLFCTLSNRIRHSCIIMPIWTKRMRIFQKRSFQRLCFLPQQGCRVNARRFNGTPFFTLLIATARVTSLVSRTFSRPPCLPNIMTV